MIFNKPKKKRDMVDLRELQKRGVVRIPRSNARIQTTSEGFVEVGKTESSEPKTSTQSNANFFSFMGPSSKKEPETQNFSTESDGYSKREVDAKITELDNKIYKMEQRVELLEKKLNVNQPSVGPMGW